MDLMHRAEHERALAELDGETVVECPPYGSAPLRHRTGRGIASWFRTAPAQIRQCWERYWSQLLAGARQVLEPPDLDRLLREPFRLHLVKPGGLLSSKRRFMVTFSPSATDKRRPPLLILDFTGEELQHAQALF
ncbi:MAG: hypothetical protein ACOCZK_06690 [Planctomycetota bacterium]